ncbi:MAG: GDSL-type esterase/lipase family protein [Deltaproteobacteria bacterium]|jgi:lysophospholipase L1-like esterase|nr:GDSL-type esterase/lipase family protein [Deltaproteobacteria bacterium]
MTHQKVIVMLGDSLTEYNRWDEAAPEAKVINQGLSGDTTGGLFYRLNLTVHNRPDLIFLQIGINDLSQGRTPEEIVAGHRRIWNALAERAPQAQLVVCSLAPISDEKFNWSSGTISNNRVRATNDLLLEAVRQASLKYLDLYKPLSDESGTLPDEFTDDGVHLAAPAYEVWVATLKSFLAAFFKS